MIGRVYISAGRVVKRSGQRILQADSPVIVWDVARAHGRWRVASRLFSKNPAGGEEGPFAARLCSNGGADPPGNLATPAGDSPVFEQRASGRGLDARRPNREFLGRMAPG